MVHVFLCNLGNCNFEKSGCGWADVSTGSEQWSVGANVSGGSAFAANGPAFDHTLGTAQGKHTVIICINICMVAIYVY